jgi:hypothetical protein
MATKKTFTPYEVTPEAEAEAREIARRWQSGRVMPCTSTASANAGRCSLESCTAQRHRPTSPEKDEALARRVAALATFYADAFAHRAGVDLDAQTVGQHRQQAEWVRRAWMELHGVTHGVGAKASRAQLIEQAISVCGERGDPLALYGDCSAESDRRDREKTRARSAIRWVADVDPTLAQQLNVEKMATAIRATTNRGGRGLTAKPTHRRCPRRCAERHAPRGDSRHHSATAKESIAEIIAPAFFCPWTRTYARDRRQTGGMQWLGEASYSSRVRSSCG